MSKLNMPPKLARIAKWTWVLVMLGLLLAIVPQFYGASATLLSALTLFIPLSDLLSRLSGD